MTDHDALLDEAWGLYLELDDQLPMWESDLDQLERWVTSSPAATADRRRRAEAMVERLTAAVDGATTAARASLLSMAQGLREVAATSDVRAELTMPNADIGLVAYLHWAVNGYALVTPEHGERYHEKLRRFPATVDDLVDRLDEAALAGRAPLRRHSERAVELIDSLLVSDVADDPLLAQAPPTESDDAAAERFRAGVAELVASHTRPALARLRDAHADRLAPAGRDDDHPGLVHRPDGEATYAALLEAYTRPGLTAAAVHEVGREQLARLDEEWSALGREAFGVVDPAEVRRRTAAVAGPATGDEVRRRAEEVHARAEAEAPRWFARVPEAPCEVRTTEHGGLAFYRTPAPDGTRPGTAFFNVADPTVWGAQLAATTVHEGIPGHHYQLALAQETPGLHELHTRLFLAANGEGWALYVERVADEMGLFPEVTDRLGMLASDALRATRLVVDTGLHALGWTRQQAIDTMVGSTGLGVVECTAEVDRYIAMPGQATSYMIGRLAIERLRDDARARLGGRFDVRAFHDTVLSSGIVSLDALELLVDDWVARSG